MKSPLNKHIQFAVLTLLCVVGSIAFLVLAGEDDPMNPMPICKWLLLKTISLTIIVACVCVGKFLHSKGYLPDDI